MNLPFLILPRKYEVGSKVNHEATLSVMYKSDAQLSPPRNQAEKPASQKLSLTSLL